ncbi:MAG: TonB-dependent receptor, partial [Acidobacteriota bacterium]|nr:TonB-dependent receptor [Acidobacteriota bacterium]
DFTGQPTIYDPNTSVPAGATFARTAFLNNKIPGNRQDQAALKLLAALPLPTFPNQSSNNFVVSPTNTIRAKRADTKGDFQFSQADSLFARYSFFGGQSVTHGPFAPPLIGSTTFQTAPKDNIGNGAAMGETHVFRPTLVNEARLGYNRIQDFLSPFVKDNVNSQFGLGGIPIQAGVTGLPAINISGFAALGEATFLPNDKISETITAQDHIAWTTGKHFIKVGADYRWVRSWFKISSSARGTYTFNGAFTQNPQKTAGSGSGLADFLLGIPSSAGLSNLNSGDIRYGYWGGYVQDDWKLTSKLTLNLGVRYELWTQPAERHDQQANFLIADRKLIFPNNKVPAGVPASLVENIPDGIGSRSLMKTDTNNFAPRLGLAYQLQPTLVIRIGAGLFYADDPANGASSRLVSNPPIFQNNTYTTDQINPILFLSSGFPANAIGSSVNVATAGVIAWAPDMQQAYVGHWSISIQKQIKNYLIETAYVGTKGTGLPVTYDINTQYAGGGSVASRRPFQGFSGITLTSALDNSNFNALEARVEHRYSKGLALLASYTYSKTIDGGGEQLVGDGSIRDARNLKAERGLSTSDQRHRFVTSVLYDLPVGNGRMLNISNKAVNAVLGNWQLNGILTVRGGTPFTPALGTSTANTGAARPNRIGNGNLPSDQRSIFNWFDKTAFVAPTPFNFGNAGRDILFGPGGTNLDASIFKSFPLRLIGEAGQVQFRAETFNVLNHPQFAQPNARVDIAQGG